MRHTRALSLRSLSVVVLGLVAVWGCAGSRNRPPPAIDASVRPDSPVTGDGPSNVDAPHMATCTDGLHNGTETDIDCGGMCPTQCADGLGCLIDRDCINTNCEASVCVGPSCMDGLRNGDETDVDCGGSCTTLCSDLRMCAVADDCQSHVCTSMRCQIPRCSDGVQNGAERGIDCGGSCAAGCPDGTMCTFAGDCASHICEMGTCLAYSCGDGIRNGPETDIDCGGPCTDCADGLMCMINTDCMSGLCGTLGTCTVACADGADNDGDGDIDYPLDPGCESTADYDETDPVPLPQCADGIDNDGDTFVDYPMDRDCSAASDNDEACALFGMDATYRGCVTRPAVMPCDDVRTTGTAACSSDDCTSPVTLPFSFTFYGTSYTSWSISSNGKEGPSVSAIYSNTCTIETNTIAPYWDDLLPPGGGSIRYQTLGTAPSRRFVVNWAVPHISGGTPYDIRAVLWEGTNRITFCYVDTTTGGAGTDSGASATVGIHGPTTFVNYSCNMPTVTDGTVIEFNTGP